MMRRWRTITILLPTARASKRSPSINPSRAYSAGNGHLALRLNSNKRAHEVSLDSAEIRKIRVLEVASQTGRCVKPHGGLDRTPESKQGFVINMLGFVCPMQRCPAAEARHSAHPNRIKISERPPGHRPCG